MRVLPGLLLAASCAALGACSDGPPHVTEAAASSAYSVVATTITTDCPLISTADMQALDPEWWKEHRYSEQAPKVEASPGTKARTLFCRWGFESDRIWVGLAMGKEVDAFMTQAQEDAVAGGAKREGSVEWSISGFSSRESAATGIMVWFSGDHVVGFENEHRAVAYRDKMLTETRQNIRN